MAEPTQPSLLDALPAAEPVQEPWWVRNPTTALDRQRAKIWHGRHPLSGVAATGPLGLHPDKGSTCGGCRFFEQQPAQGEGAWPRPKCVFGATRREDGSIAAATRYLVPAPRRWYERTFEDTEQDLEPWFPACTDHQPEETRR